MRRSLIPLLSKRVKIVPSNNHNILHNQYQYHNHYSFSTTTTKLFDLNDSYCNVPPNIVKRIGRNLHLQKNHPLCTIKGIITNHIQMIQKTKNFTILDDLNPIVSTIHNFDSLLIPPHHVSRSPSDTYYINQHTVLRTHTSAHQTTLLSQGHDSFLVTGDVYRYIHTYINTLTYIYIFFLIYLTTLFFSFKLLFKKKNHCFLIYHNNYPIFSIRKSCLTTYGLFSLSLCNIAGEMKLIVHIIQCFIKWKE